MNEPEPDPTAAWADMFPPSPPDVIPAPADDAWGDLFGEAGDRPPQPQFLLIVIQNGEWPRVVMMSAAQFLIDRLRRMDGEDVVAIPILGIPLHFSDDKARDLKLPDRLLRLEPDGTIRHGDIPPDFTHQQNWYLGTTQLAALAEFGATETVDPPVLENMRPKRRRNDSPQDPDDGEGDPAVV